MTAHLHAAARTLATGFVLCFWSERAFWSFWRPADAIPDALVTWAAYSVLAAIVLALARTYRVSAFGPLFLVGAVYGWLAEGGIVTTMYGDATNPFPLSLSWTGLAWHALLTVYLGWWWVGGALASRVPRATLVRSAALGAGAGFWAIWWQNDPGIRPVTGVGAFAWHFAAFSLGLAIAWWVLGRVPAPAGPPSRRECIGLLVLALAFVLGVRVPATPVAAAVLVPLLGVCWLGLRRSSRTSDGPDVAPQMASGYGARDCAPLLATPVAACVVYACLAWTKLPANICLYLVTMPLGFWFLGRSLWAAIRPPRRAEAAGG